MRRIVIAIVSSSLLLAVAPRSANATWPNDPSVNVPVCTAPGYQGITGTPGSHAALADGAGGVFTVWMDRRSGSNYDLYAQRIGSTGAALWTANGVAVCTAGGDQNLNTFVPGYSMISDGAGGFIVTWFDNRSGDGGDIYVQRFNGAGVAQWTANGVALCTAALTQSYPVLTTDGAGGAIVAWGDGRSGTDDIYARRVTSAGAPQWASNGIAVCGASGIQGEVSITTDGAGGAIATWQDYRTAGHIDVFAQRVNGAGTVQWTANGVGICTTAGSHYPIRVVTDGGGGAFITWGGSASVPDGDFDGQRVNATGTPQWTVNGISLVAAPGSASQPNLIFDGLGGFVLTWSGHPTDFGQSDPYTQRFNGSGAPQWTTPSGVLLASKPGQQLEPVAAVAGTGGFVYSWSNYGDSTLYAQALDASGVRQWGVNGVAVSMGTRYRMTAAIVTNGSGGALLTWVDGRNEPDPFTTSNSDLYAQRVTLYGGLGGQEPSIVDVVDVPYDQGGKVHVLWNSSDLDLPPFNFVDSYTLWRRLTTTAARRGIEQGSAVWDGGPSVRGSNSASVRPLRRTTQGATTTYWEFVATIPARHQFQYAYMAPTTADSMPGLIPYDVFFVDAVDDTGAFYVSAVDSGYSVDNLPPGPPSPFAGIYASGATTLHWAPRLESDFSYYRLHRGSAPDFVPGPGNLIASTTDTTWTDPGPPGSTYKLAAMDVHGNPSAWAVLGPGGILGVPARPGPLELAAPYPNPSGARLALRFVLPRRTRATLRILDVQGRSTRVLVDEALEAGPHERIWDGADRNGRSVANGVYVARLETDAGVRTRRLVRTK